jgi:hypothetical protein
MPHVVPTMVQAYAHCPDPVCPGHEQQQVDAVHVETFFMYTDNGGDLPGFERSVAVLSYADESDGHPSEVAPCPHCDLRRELSGTPRRQYDRLSGYSPDYLISRNAKPFDPSKPPAAPEDLDGRVKDLESQVATLAGQVDALLAALKDKAEAA